jgi:hypothetical protein
LNLIPRIDRKCSWDIPAELLERLTHLTIWNATNLGRMGTVFSRATSLVSLALVQVTGREIFQMFRDHHAACQHLTEFKLGLFDQMHPGGQDTLAICDFIREKPLHRLDIDAPGSDLWPILDILPQLTQLTALGMDARTFTSEADVESLASALPVGLVALHTQHPWEGLTYNSYEFQPLVSS